MTRTMKGPYVLNPYHVDMVVSPRMHGVFGLSNKKESIELIKRSDTSICAEIKNHVGSYRYFWVRTAASAQEAFRYECELFHRHPIAGPGGNHPSPSEGAKWPCPLCGELTPQAQKPG